MPNDEQSDKSIDLDSSGLADEDADDECCVVPSLINFINTEAPVPAEEAQ